MSFIIMSIFVSSQLVFMYVDVFVHVFIQYEMSLQ